MSNNPSAKGHCQQYNPVGRARDSWSGGQGALGSTFACLFGFLTLLGYIAGGLQDWRLTILRAATHETERGDHDFCLSRSHYTDNDPTSRERAATAGIEPRTSSRVLPTELPHLLGFDRRSRRPLPIGWVDVSIMWPVETEVMVSPLCRCVAAGTIVRRQ